MSLEAKIKELLESKKSKAQQLQEKTTDSGLNAPDEAQHAQGSSQKAQYTVVDPHTGMAVNPEDSSLKKGGAEAKQKQGSSEDADYTEMDPHAAAVNTPDTSLRKGNSEPQHRQGNSRDAEYTVATGTGSSQPASGAGNFAQPTTPGQGVKAFEEADLDDDVITEEDIAEEEKLGDAEYENSAADKKADKKAKRKMDMKVEELRKDIESVFAADTNLSEEFKTQASAIFEAAVIARVNNEVEAISEELVEQNAAEFEEIKEGLVEKVDSYLNYVVEQWMKDNEIEVEQGLRTEVAEDFMIGLKNLFQEHYFEVPADKVDVLEDMGAKVDEITARLDESVAVNVELKAELDAIKRERIIESACRDLTATDAEKMVKLLEGVDFDNEKLFEEKVSVVKENYFPGSTPNSPEQMLEEDVQVASPTGEAKQVPAHMKSYVEALSRTAKVKHLN
jgi:hypothetical protein